MQHTPQTFGFRLISKSFRIAGEYFCKSKAAPFALVMLIALIAFELLFVYVNVELNKWNVGFFNAIQDLNQVAFSKSVIAWLYLLVAFIGVFMVKLFINLWLTLKWRIWLTENYLNKWLSNKSFYGSKILGYESDNPDQRIANDINSFTSTFIDLTMGLLSSVVTFCSFIVILWNLGGSLEFTLLGKHHHIPGYLVWLALLYSGIATYVAHIIGKKLIRLQFEQERKEANFRFSMMRVREYAESIALYNAGMSEKSSIIDKFFVVVANYKQIIYKLLSLALFRNVYVIVGNIAPVIMMAPKLFSKQLHFGEMMQGVSAFRQILDSLSFIISSYSALAGFMAVTARLEGFLNSIDEWEETDHKVEYKEDDHLAFALKSYFPSGELMFDIRKTKLKGDTLIQGTSGAGKSTLFRILAKMWPFAEGEVIMPSGKKLLYIPQKSYINTGTLRQVLTYPSNSCDILEQLLKEFDLEHLTLELDVEKDWSKILSGGEQQRIALIRAIIDRPDIIFMDEATSSLNSKLAQAALLMVKKHLPQAQLILISHDLAMTKVFPNVYEFADKQLKSI
ncbi:MAG: ABC transporter ATP-binding protein/permease [Rickettsiales bacterium]